MKTKGRRESKNLKDITSPKQAERHDTEKNLENAVRRRLSGDRSAEDDTIGLNTYSARRMRTAINRRMEEYAPTTPKHASKFEGKASKPTKKAPSTNGTPDRVAVPDYRPKETQVTPGEWKTEQGKKFSKFAKGR